MATAALVCGIAGLFLFFLLVVSVVALVLGLVAESRAKKASGPNTGLGRARAGWILGAVGVAGFVAMMIGIGVTGGFDDDEVSVIDLDVGDCVDVPTEDTDTVEELPRRECDEPHDAEVFAVGDVTLDSEEYPGVNAVVTEVEATCAGEVFEEYVGLGYQQSALDIYTLYPIADGWEDGDRGYVCLAYNVDGSALTEPVEGSAR